MIIDSFRLSGKIAIVTGGSRGLGRSIAIGLGEAGAQVVVISRTKKLIEETANEIIKIGGEAIAIPADVTKVEDIEEMKKAVLDKFGKIDILINNAGIAPMNKAQNISIEEWDRVIETNLKSVFLMARIVGERMIQQKKGKIINISSVLGKMASNTALHYCASKAGIIQMTKALALEWAGFGIHVNCIAPGFFETEMIKEHDETQRKFLMFKIPFKRTGKPEEIVGTVIFLASEASDYITGETIFVDGGYSIW
jgi:NAD(P)-dependent dehydrogenase (short-subunit alcohol dehydrogenase family)